MTGSKSPSIIFSKLCQDFLIRWSVRRFWGKLYVLIFSARIAAPIWLFLSWLNCASSCSLFRAKRRARRTCMAISLLLCCVRSSWQVTMMPVGRWRSRTADSRLLTYWPPGPEARKTSTRISLGLILNSVSSASGKTATEAVEVWTRPDFSVAGIR